MGWNDIGKLVFVSIFAAILSINFILSQEKTLPGAKETSLPPAYLLKPVFRVHNYYNYILYDTSEVVRIYKDSSTVKYTRNMIYYLTLVQPDPPVDGFSRVEVSIDSIYYRFQEGQKVYEFSSIENSNPNVFKFEDFQTYSIPMSMEFTIVYSPYGEVAKIEGERLLEKRRYIDTLKATIPDSIWYFNWVDGLSDSRLKQIADVIKITFPINPVYKDSIWSSPIELQIDGINVIDTLDLKCTGFFNNKYSIEGVFKNPSLEWKKTKFYGIKTLSFPHKIARGQGVFKQILSAAGLVQSLNINLDLEIFVGEKSENILFTEKIKKNLKWEMVKSFKFR